MAPIFLQGLSDLSVMDGSQVTMTVQVSGLFLHPSPRGRRENRLGGNMASLPDIPLRARIRQKISMGKSDRGPKEVGPLSAFLGRIFWIES